MFEHGGVVATWDVKTKAGSTMLNISFRTSEGSNDLKSPIYPWEFKAFLSLPKVSYYG